MPLTYYGQHYEEAPDGPLLRIVPFKGCGYLPFLTPAEFGDVRTAQKVPHHPPGKLSLSAVTGIAHDAARRLHEHEHQYKNVAIELFYWDIDEPAKMASKRLGATFRKYGYIVTENELHSRQCDQNYTAPIDRVFGRACFRHYDDKDTLVIMHYVGRAKEEYEGRWLSNFHVVSPPILTRNHLNRPLVYNLSLSIGLKLRRWQGAGDVLWLLDCPFSQIFFETQGFKQGLFCSAASGSLKDRRPSTRRNHEVSVDFTNQLSVILEDALAAGKALNLAGIFQELCDSYNRKEVNSVPVLLEHYIEGLPGNRRFRPSLCLEPIADASSRNLDTVAGASQHAGQSKPSTSPTRVRICVNTDVNFDRQAFAQLCQDSDLSDVLQQHFRILDQQDQTSSLLLVSVSTALWSVMPRGHVAIGLIEYEMDELPKGAETDGDYILVPATSAGAGADFASTKSQGTDEDAIAQLRVAE